MGMQLVINPGSASKKYSLYDEDSLVLNVHFEHNTESCAVSFVLQENEKQEIITESTYIRSLEKVLEEARLSGILNEKKVIDAIGVRIVAPGSYFTQHRLIDDEYVEKMEDLQRYAPLHISSTLSEIRAAKKLLPSINMYGVSDSEFHITIPEANRLMLIDPKDVDKYDIHHFGYHGLSVQSVFRKAREQYGDLSRAIVCHLGSGMSITALKDGKSIETSMGFTPATGLPMSVRTGDLDHEALLYLMQRKNFSVGEAQEYLRKESGYRTLTGGVSDMRVLLDLFEKGDEKATLAIGVLKNRLKKYIGSYIAVLGGLDLIALTATTNERNATARALFFGDLDHLGIEIDTEKNNSQQEGQHGLIGSGKGALVSVIHTDEMGEIARVSEKMQQMR
jgi:acetate kinase